MSKNKTPQQIEAQKAIKAEAEKKAMALAEKPEVENLEKADPEKDVVIEKVETEKPKGYRVKEGNFKDKRNYNIGGKLVLLEVGKIVSEEIKNKFHEKFQEKYFEKV